MMGLKTIYCVDIEDHDVVEETVRVAPQPLGVARYTIDISRLSINIV